MTVSVAPIRTDILGSLLGGTGAVARLAALTGAPAYRGRGMAPIRERAKAFMAVVADQR